MIINNYHIISDAVVIAFATYFIYLVIFAYQSAYARILGISPNLISVTLTDIFDKIIPLICSLVVAGILLFIFTWAKNVAEVLNVIIKIITLIIFFCFYLFCQKFHEEGAFKWYIGVLTPKRIMIIIGTIIVILFFERNKSIFGNYTIPLINIKLDVNVIWFQILTVMSSYTLGMIQIITMKSYSVLNIENKNDRTIKKVILCIYGNNIIIADAYTDTKYHTVNNYSVLKFPLPENITFSLDTTIGPLRAKIK